MTPEELRAKVKARDRFVTRLLREPKIMLKGELRELGESRQDRALIRAPSPNYLLRT